MGDNRREELLGLLLENGAAPRVLLLRRSDGGPRGDHCGREGVRGRASLPALLHVVPGSSELLLFVA